MADAKAAPQPYTGLTLAFLTFVLSMANVMEVLDLTIANVAIPTITGDLGVAPSQATKPPFGAALAAR
jgi:DHA2 family multidrug resistance protein